MIEIDGLLFEDYMKKWKREYLFKKAKIVGNLFDITANEAIELVSVMFSVEMALTSLPTIESKILRQILL